jgi:hypothetical protein
MHVPVCPTIFYDLLKDIVHSSEGESFSGSRNPNTAG